MMRLIVRELGKIQSLRSRRNLRRDMMGFYAQFISSGDLCFDVGANVGQRTDIFLALGAQVVCIEPQPKCVDVLREKYRNNPQVAVVPKGVARQPGILSLYVCESAGTISTFSEKWKTGRFRDHRWESEVDVPVTTLDDLIQEFGLPKLCKIDVEGYEYEVLQGLSCAIPISSFEFTREFIDDAKTCMDHLESLGDAEFNYALGAIPKLVLSEWTSADTLLHNLSQIADDLLWGDIYVRFHSNVTRVRSDGFHADK